MGIYRLGGGVETWVYIGWGEVDSLEDQPHAGGICK